MEVFQAPMQLWEPDLVVAEQDGQAVATVRLVDLVAIFADPLHRPSLEGMKDNQDSVLEATAVAVVPCFQVVEVEDTPAEEVEPINPVSHLSMRSSPEAEEDHRSLVVRFPCQKKAGTSCRLMDSLLSNVHARSVEHSTDSVCVLSRMRVCQRHVQAIRRVGIFVRQRLLMLVDECALAMQALVDPTALKSTRVRLRHAPVTT
mmetsp:Transcript_101549/g.141050  ORF Transcript_101549/g.141050 Transcript_101549/m.141050 type:complete len:203 (+) Transcript_101549:4246-4854(+)